MQEFNFVRPRRERSDVYVRAAQAVLSAQPYYTVS
jgi:hypothetical protein